MQPLSPHAPLEAILRFPHDPMSADEAGQVLGRDGSTISMACRHGKIASTASNFKGKGNQRCYRIAKSNLIRWLWQNEQGDKAMLRAAMEQLCPRILKTLEPAHQPRPRNVLPFEHPDLFHTPTAQQSA
jgi:DNA-binding transcriptional regulator GbsR (MarR family)